MSSARRGEPFRSAIAHGYLSLAIVGPAAMEVWIRPAKIGAALNYGLDRVRFIAPVLAGKRIRSRIKLLAVEPKGDGRTLITTENTVEIEATIKPALVANMLTMAIAYSFSGPVKQFAPHRLIRICRRARRAVGA